MHAKFASVMWTFWDHMDCSLPGSWSGLSYPSPGDLPNPRIKPTSLMSPALAVEFFTTVATWEVKCTTHLRTFCVWRKAEKNMVGGTENFGSDYLDYLNKTLHCSMLFLENENWFNLILSKPSNASNHENTRMFLLLLTWILRHLIIYLLNSKYDLISKEFHIPVVINIETAKPAVLK